MSLSLVKWMLVALALVLVAAAVAGFATRKVFLAERVIPAPPEAVWAVLMDTQAYAQWNPFFVEVDGAYAEGRKLRTKFRDDSGALVSATATVKTLRAEQELRQVGGFPGILTFDHSWLLEPVPGGTKVVQKDVNRGIALWFWDSDWVQPAYAAANAALAERVQASLQ